MDRKNQLRYFLEYLFVKSVFSVFSRLELSSGRALGRFLGRTAGTLLSSRSRLAEANLRAAFPQAAPPQIETWVRECWENLGMSLAEFAKGPGLSREDFHKRVDVEGMEHLLESHKKGKGVLAFTAHYGNWELNTLAIAFTGVPLAAVARRMKNPYVNDFITRTRSRSNVQVFMHKNAVRDSIRWLKKGNVLGLLIDQRITDGGVTVPFLGRPAYTTTMLALLALRLGSPVHAVHCTREGERVRVRVDPAMDLSKYQPAEADIIRATAEMTAVMESWVRERPPLWLWIHDRWKM